MVVISRCTMYVCTGGGCKAVLLVDVSPDGTCTCFTSDVHISCL